MKSLKKMIGTLGLMGIILVGASSANAGMLISDRLTRTENPTACGGEVSMVDTVGIIVLSRVLGVTVNVEPTPCSDGMLISDRNGMLISD